jgi:hypothetical protein
MPIQKNQNLDKNLVSCIYHLSSSTYAAVFVKEQDVIRDSFNDRALRGNLKKMLGYLAKTALREFRGDADAN